MKKINKKAFTIVELVIVIALIAILAAVLIPTFTGVVNNANESKDTQLARNMNTAIAVMDAEGNINSLTDAMYAIALEGINSIKAEKEGCQFMWDQENKKVLYVDADYNVVNYDGYNPEDHNKWLTMIFDEVALSGNSSSYSDLFGN